MNRIIHMTTVHPRVDIRIRIKQVSTLARELDDDVKLYVQDGLGDEHDQAGFDIIDTGARDKNRLKRMAFGSWRMFKAVKAAKPKIVHFHDPELIPIGALLRLCGIIVLYDVHEDLPRQMLAKDYIPKPLRWIMSFLALISLWFIGIFANHIVLTGASAAYAFPKKKSILVYNYPILEEFQNIETHSTGSVSKNFVYIGGLSETRGAMEIVRAIALVNDVEASLSLAGPFQPPALLDQAKQQAGWQKTTYHDWLSREEIPSFLGNAAAGLVTLHPTDSYLLSYPTKLYEYMGAGLPVIASDFASWRDNLKGVECAIFVDPLNPQEIADAMQWIVDNPKEAEEMGKRGQKAIVEKYSWNVEAMKLVALYRSLLVKN